MTYFLYGFFIVVLFFVTINYLRKLHWDAIHHNLYDLSDEIGGKIIRKGLLARPVFHGKFKGCDITINFSQEKNKNGRKNYIDISLNKKVKHSLTIVSLDWIKTQKESMDDLEIFKIDGGTQYGLNAPKRSKLLQEKHHNTLIKHLNNLHPFNYIFIGETGVIFEKESQNVALDTRHPRIKMLLDLIYNFIRDVQRR